MGNPYHFDKFGEKVSTQKKYVLDREGKPTKHYTLGDYSEPIPKKRKKR